MSSVVSANPSPCEAAPGETQAFLIPSVFGDEPPLRNLRRRLKGTIDFDLLPLPDAGAPGALLTDMAATGRLLAGEVVRRQPVGDVRLVGYSFGASMALEVAAQLAEVGRAVAFLGALDGPFEPPAAAPSRPAASLLSVPRRLLRTAVVDATGSLDSVRRFVARAVPPETTAGDRAEPMRRAMLWHLRNKALKTWTPRGCAAPGLHVATGDYGAANRARWAELCPHLRYAEVRAPHEHLLEGQALDAVVIALKDAVTL